MWREISRPHGSLKLNERLNGILDFSKEYKGELITESMIIKSMIFKPEEIEKIAEFISRVNHSRCYLAVSTKLLRKIPPDLDSFSEAPIRATVLGLNIRSNDAEFIFPTPLQLFSKHDSSFYSKHFPWRLWGEPSCTKRHTKTHSTVCFPLCVLPNTFSL